MARYSERVGASEGLLTISVRDLMRAACSSNSLIKAGADALFPPSDHTGIVSKAPVVMLIWTCFVTVFPMRFSIQRFFYPSES